MSKKRFEVEVPDGQHLGHSTDSGGAYRGLLFDKTGKLVGHADLHEVSEPDAQPDFDYVTDDAEPSSSWAEVLAPWALLGVAVAAAKGAQHIQSRREDAEDRKRKRSKRQSREEPSSPQAQLPRARATPPAAWYVDARNPAWLRFWDGQAWTAHVSPNPEVRPAPGSATAPMASSARQVTAAHHEPTVSMSSIEWQQRLRAMLLARAFSEQQLRLLSHARIEDASPGMVELQHALAVLTPQELSHRINLMLEANPSSLTGVCCTSR